MSLSGFHLFFVSVSFILAAAVGAWGVRIFSEGGGVTYLIVAIVCFVLAIALVPYGIKVRQKLKALEEEE